MTNTQAWDYAVGMIKVDGLEPTQEFREYIEKEKRGEVMEAVNKILGREISATNVIPIVSPIEDFRRKRTGTLFYLCMERI